MPSYAVTDPASNRHSRLINRTPFFYGWIILVVGTLGIVMMGPSQTFTVTLFVDSFVADLGISRANVSLLYGLATLGASALLPITGRFVDRYGTRYMILFVSFGTGLVCMALSTVSGALTLFAGLLAIRFLGFGSVQLRSIVCLCCLSFWQCSPYLSVAQTANRSNPTVVKSRHRGQLVRFLD